MIGPPSALTDSAAVPPAVGVLPALTLIVPLLVTVIPPFPMFETAMPFPLMVVPGLTVTTTGTGRLP